MATDQHLSIKAISSNYGEFWVLNRTQLKIAMVWNTALDQVKQINTGA